MEVRPGEVSFAVAPGTARCTVSIEGLPTEISDQVYGADSLQALHLASDVEALLRRLTAKYDLFFPTGEAYFEEE
jgi:hypothetical protein